MIKKGRKPNKVMICHKAPWKAFSTDSTGKFWSARFASRVAMP